MNPTRRLADPALFWLAIALTGIGLLFIFDAGYARSLRDGRGMIPREFLMQVPFLTIGIVCALFLSRLNPVKLKRASILVFLLGMLFLIAVEIPGIGVEMSGAARWIGRSPFLIQPAEFFKVAVIVYLAGVFADRKAWPANMPKFPSFWAKMDAIAGPKFVRCLPALWVLLGVFMIEREPDLGTAAVVAATAFAMFVLGGASKWTLIAGAVLACIGTGYMIKSQPYRMERITNHAQRWSPKNVDDVGYQTVQSELAQATGGWIGVGVGAGRAKHVIPAPTTDFVMATVGEEFGLLGSVGVLGLLGALVARLIWLANRAPTRFGMLFLGGVAAWLAVQSATNVMMANGTAPAIGIPLPFISSGGSSLIALWMAIGLCQAVMRPVPVAREAVVETDRDRWRHGRTHLSRA